MSSAATHDPFPVVLGEIAGLWLAANAGYFYILPLLGYQISYNASPIAIAIYFLLWAGISLFSFWSLFTQWLKVERRIWVYILWSLGFAALTFALIYFFSFLPAVDGVNLAPYTDILLASPWYFLPKAAEVLVQQILITVLVLQLSFRSDSLKEIMARYFVCFGSAHILTFLVLKAPTHYALVLTAGALLSALVFPYLILRVKGGFIYTYSIHFMFYVVLAIVLHAWPPAGYFG